MDKIIIITVIISTFVVFFGIGELMIRSNVRIIDKWWDAMRRKNVEDASTEKRGIYSIIKTGAEAGTYKMDQKRKCNRRML